MIVGRPDRGCCLEMYHVVPPVWQLPWLIEQFDSTLSLRCIAIPVGGELGVACAE